MIMDMATPRFLKNHFTREGREAKALKRINEVHLKALKAQNSFIERLFGKSAEEHAMEMYALIKAEKISPENALPALLDCATLVKAKNPLRDQILNDALNLVEKGYKKDPDAQLEHALDILKIANKGSDAYKRAQKMAEASFKKIERNPAAYFKNAEKYSEMAITLAQHSSWLTRGRNIQRVMDLNQHVLAAKGGVTAAEHIKQVAGLNAFGKKRAACIEILRDLTPAIEKELGPVAAIDHLRRTSRLTSRFSAQRADYADKIHNIAVRHRGQTRVYGLLQAHQTERWLNKKEHARNKIVNLTKMKKGDLKDAFTKQAAMAEFALKVMLPKKLSLFSEKFAGLAKGVTEKVANAAANINTTTKAPSVFSFAKT